MTRVMELPPPQILAAPPAWNLAWLTPARCRLLFAAILLLGFLGHLRYLQDNCPLDLSGDEAQYWDWSRALDLSYYSKGPLVAYIIRASCSLFGDTMWAVRLPALILAAATTLLTYWLTQRLFKSDRLALGVVLLNHVVPMFVIGSLLMTIDPPYFFCWGLACAFLALAVLEERRWAWIAAGFAIGTGTLAKYGMLLWPVGMILFLMFDRRSRKWLKTIWPWLAILIGLAFLTPPLIWNSRHDWVTFKHVATQTGAAKQSHFFNGNFWELVGSQLGVLGPGLVVILAGAIIYARGRTRLTAWMQRVRGKSKIIAIFAKRLHAIAALANAGSADPNRRAQSFLLWMGLPLFTLCFLGAIRSKMQINWPAAAYFSFMILAGYFLSTRLLSRATWKPWRIWFWGAAIFGIAFSPIAHDSSLLFPLSPAFKAFNKKQKDDGQVVDIAEKLKGWKQLGQRVSRELETLHNPIVIGEDYQKTAELAFYVKGQPKTFCIGPYITRLEDRKRRSQYDEWPDRNLAQPQLHGCDAIYVGYKNDDLLRAFDSVEELPEEPIFERGYKVRRFKIYRCKNFKGLQIQPPGGN